MKIEWHPQDYWAERRDDHDETWLLSGSPRWCLRSRKVRYMVNTWNGSKWLEDEFVCNDDRRSGACCFCDERSVERTACAKCADRIIQGTRRVEILVGGSDDLTTLFVDAIAPVDNLEALVPVDTDEGAFA